MDRRKITLFCLLILAVFSFALPVFFSSAQNRDLLTPEENLWLKSRNNTIVVYPEQNNPPYSYQSASGNIQGLSIDYLELVAEKIGAKLQYLTSRSRSQVLVDLRAGKGDVAYLSPDKEKEDLLIFTESYITVPVVIVVRKDAERKSGLTLNDFNGKKVAMVENSAAESYVRINYPRVVRETVTDDEVGLQQVVLGEVEAVTMDVASLSFYLSKQVLSSVTIAGNIGLDYKPAFALSRDRAILQSILEKGLSQISASDRTLLTDKWISLPVETKRNDSLLAVIQSNLSTLTLYLLLAVGLLGIIVFLVRRRHFSMPYFRRAHNIKEIKEEIGELEGASNMLAEELKEVKEEEEKLKDKLESLNK